MLLLILPRKIRVFRDSVMREKTYEEQHAASLTSWMSLMSAIGAYRLHLRRKMGSFRLSTLRSASLGCLSVRHGEVPRQAGKG
jgi:hypothetical protein